MKLFANTCPCDAGVKALVMWVMPNLAKCDEELLLKVGDLYWPQSLHSRSSSNDDVNRVTGYYLICAAALKDSIFYGFDSISRASLEDEPIGLPASPIGVASMILSLYTNIYDHAPSRDLLDANPDGLPLTNGVDMAIEIAEMMEQAFRSDPRSCFKVAAVQIVAIAHWANNFRRRPELRSVA